MVEPHIEEKQLRVEPKMIRAGYLGIKERKLSNTSWGGGKRKQIPESTEEMNA